MQMDFYSEVFYQRTGVFTLTGYKYHRSRTCTFICKIRYKKKKFVIKK